MKLHIVARGRIGRGPEAELLARYARRLGSDFAVTELAETGAGKLPEPLTPHVTIVLDERGTALGSRALAARLERFH